MVIKKVFRLIYIFLIVCYVRAENQYEVATKYTCPHCSNEVNWNMSDTSKGSFLEKDLESLFLEVISTDDDYCKELIAIITDIRNLMSNFNIFKLNCEYEVGKRYQVDDRHTTNIDDIFGYITGLDSDFLRRENNFDPSKEIVTKDGKIVPGMFPCPCSIINPFTGGIAKKDDIPMLLEIKRNYENMISLEIIFLNANDAARWNAMQIMYWVPEEIISGWQRFRDSQGFKTCYINWERERVVQFANFISRGGLKN